MNKKFKLIFITSIIFMFLFSLIKPNTYAWYTGKGSIKVNYVDEQGTALMIADDGSSNLRSFNFQFDDAGKEYSIPSPEYEGYTPDIDIVTGVFQGDVETTVTYYKNQNYKLIINCVDIENNIIKTLEYEYENGYQYNIDLDIIEGMTPSQKTLIGTLDKDETFNITYTKNVYKLTINCVDKDGNNIKTVEYNYEYGYQYNIDLDIVNGMTPSQATLSGTITDDTSFDITYTKNVYKLIINCVDKYGNILKKLEYNYEYGYQYNIDLDIVDGMAPSQTNLFGTMTSDSTFTITYTYRIRTVIIHYYDINFRRFLFDEIICFEGNGYLTIYPPQICGYYTCPPFTIYVDKDLDVYVTYQIINCSYRCINYCI
ncbi:MAG: MucBP domain-containing protein [Acholeplasmatales bacterium]|nr:MucBP domain-containing protein [Acholeplasmatales bacterium]